MIRAECVLAAVAASAAFLSACGGDMDSCAGDATCVLLEVQGVSIEAIDQLELDLVYDGHHATTTTGTVGHPVSLPLTLPIRLDLGSPLIHIEVVAAGKIGGRLIALGSGSNTVQQGYHADLLLLLEPVEPCTEGALYCAGDRRISADVNSLYRCSDGVPIFYARCSIGCTSHFEDDGECFGGGVCRDGGTYCGGHVLDGDPRTLYICNRLHGITPMQCPNGCLVRGDGDDVCM